MKLHELKPAEGSRKGIKRVGRGVASGWGKTAGRGNKGHKARSGGQTSPGFEGGQMPMQRRLPKRGFANIFRKRIAIVNIRDLARFESGSVVDRAALIKIGLIKGEWDGVKLLAQGEITVPLTVRLSLISESAKAKIEGAGGKVEVEA
ncbi:50S ribosomal protein L15 [bacterium]|jgi:large subunit ribosomal protein L15|nr:50S ribosomal protein L15 [bacterium]